MRFCISWCVDFHWTVHHIRIQPARLLASNMRFYAATMSQATHYYIPAIFTDCLLFRLSWGEYSNYSILTKMIVFKLQFLFFLYCFTLFFLVHLYFILRNLKLISQKIRIFKNGFWTSWLCKWATFFFKKINYVGNF